MTQTQIKTHDQAHLLPSPACKPGPSLTASPLDRVRWRPAARSAGAAVLAVGALLLAGCVGTNVKTFGVQESFGSVSTYSRMFDATPAQTCEASRRALLSQGYIISSSSADLVEGKKSFQPEAESHLQMVVRVVCVPEASDGKVSLGFVTALQDTYALRKTNNSASLGVGAIGSVSLPLSASSESMVKVGSETISKDTFYESFFDLVKRYLIIDQAQALGG
ncbi:DUF2242 domain-containing protein [Acidovorax sp. sic0104]|uniref:DUF2242 domain-containing protein n=1 Tax=Acidovorax sp. sic0104 TaxID=2854784 RepID=UPI001C45B306|nr:DUF2242 domain-containing protein [Acidovorax sp. sic0104]MBV7542757.1 DUF2242 domain-containing protein [Acidovorax sp. sic0104]